MLVNKSELNGTDARGDGNMVALYYLAQAGSLG